MVRAADAADDAVHLVRNPDAWSDSEDESKSTWQVNLAQNLLRMAIVDLHLAMSCRCATKMLLQQNSQVFCSKEFHMCRL